MIAAQIQIAATIAAGPNLLEIFLANRGETARTAMSLCAIFGRSK